MKKILITGISGFIGHYLHKYRPNDVLLTGTYFLNKPEINGVDLVKLDLTKIDEFINKSAKFDIIIHCAAEANLGECEKHPDEAIVLNTQATEKLAQWSAIQKSKFIFLSTDIVFEGIKGDYSENETPDPINVYGKTKLEAEERIINIHDNAVIVRLALCLGKGLGNTISFIDWFENKLENNNEIPLYFDEIRTPVSTIFAASAIWDFVSNDFIGIVHLTGKEKINRYDLGLKILDHLKSDKKFLLKKKSSQNAVYPRPKDVSMNSNVLDKVLNTTREDLSTFIKNIL